MYYGTDHHARFQSGMAYVTRGDTPKGAPVASTGRKRHKGSLSDGAGRNSGVSAHEHYLPHRYHDEGDKGPQYRRTIRRLSAALWQAEWQEEQDSELREMMAYGSCE